MSVSVSVSESVSESESVSVCVCVPVADRRPKPMDRSRSNSISRVLLQISPAVLFSFSTTPKIMGSSREKIKKIDFLKNGSNDFD